MPVEDNNQLVHARSMPVADGVVLSLTTLPDLTPTQEESFRRIGLHRVSDLLHLRAVHDAQLISALGRVVHDVENHAAAGRVGRRHRTGRAPCQPIDVLAAIDDDVARKLNGVRVCKEP